MPKIFYFNNNLKKFGTKEKIIENALFKTFDINNIYIFTYYLQCIYSFLLKDNIEDNIKEEYLCNFIEIHHIDKLIINSLLNISLESNNCRIIKIDCIRSIINIIYKIEEYKKKNDNIDEDKNIEKNQVLQKLTDILSNLILINNVDNSESQEEIDDNLDDKIYELGKKIFNFIKYITNKDNTYINFIFNDPEKFINIFVKDFIKYILY